MAQLETKRIFAFLILLIMLQPGIGISKEVFDKYTLVLMFYTDSSAAGTILCCLLK